jgi:HTH-type transcriptional regulator/antitoxin HigA
LRTILSWKAAQATPASDVPHLAHVAKRASYDDISASQLAWLFRVRHIAREMAGPSYNKATLERALNELREARRHIDGVRQVPRLMYEAGVRFVVVENLPGGKIDGVCLWLDAMSPVIAMSLRFDRIDHFWFVLRHECAHVLHEHGRSAVIIDADLEERERDNLSEDERLADDESAEFCIPQAQMRSFYLRKNPLFSERDVLAFAKKIGVHPGLVVGQLQRLTNRYDLLRRHLVKVRDTLAMSMMLDGWGDVVPVEQQ